MAKPELGTKRLCGNCAAKFYDLNKAPIVCPKCNTVQELAAMPARGRQDVVAARAVAQEDEPVLPETQDAEFVSLEEADAEASGSGKKPAKGSPAEAADDDIEMDETLDDAAFIEEQEEGDDDVTDIIGDVDNEEEA